jgi:hypothetical protein
VFTGDAGVVSMVALSDVEEAGHSLRHQLIIFQDDTILGVIDTFAAEQGMGREATEDLDNDIIRDAGQCIPLVGGPPLFRLCAVG